ncbi:MAG: carbohydrate-binding domain-containing protein, partial [Oscillibacter sp.]|nr:carbohydrate-binding domain-containing protein [Oscillibacter sp.]
MKKLTFKRTMISAIALTTLLNAMPLVANASYTGGVTRAAYTNSAVSVPASSTTLTFSNSGVTATGSESGYKVEGTALTIQEAGVYTITGTCTEGSITVKKGTTGVTLILQDLTLASSTTAPLSCNKETGVTLYAVGTVTLTDKESLANEESDDFEGAAIKVKSGAALTITGTGTLTADGSACKNGIKGAAESAITVEGALTLNVKAANNGIAADGEVIINSGTVNVTADGDGIKAEPDSDDTASKGAVTVNGGSVTIVAQGDGVQATGDVTITGGAFDIRTHGGAANAKQLGTDDSAKGIKSDSRVIISGGTFALNSADDALHANGNVTVTGGSYTIQAGDDAFHADYDLTIGEEGGSGPEITVASSYEGLEGARIYLNSGSGTITASDDGVNAATDATASEIALYINGGDWTIDANGDGLDAGGDSTNNRGGSIYVNGGVTKVFGAANGGNAALDYDGTCEYNGGTLLTVDVTGMNQQPRTGTYVLFGTAASMG